MYKIFTIILTGTLLMACNAKTAKNNSTDVTLPDTVATIINVEGMSCDHCKMTIQESVGELPGVFEVKANFEDSTTFVKYDVSKVNIEKINAAITHKGYKVTGIKEPANNE